MRALLDVNVLIALLDSDHVFHSSAMDWLSVNYEVGWASCPITENGCLRIMSQTKYPGKASLVEVANRLKGAQESDFHEFWSDQISVLDEGSIDLNRVHSPRQLTDVYLLALAVAHKGKFVTFDRKISESAVKTASTNQLEIIS